MGEWSLDNDTHGIGALRGARIQPPEIHPTSVPPGLKHINVSNYWARESQVLLRDWISTNILPANAGYFFSVAVEWPVLAYT